jgi:hypothetical protein
MINATWTGVMQAQRLNAKQIAALRPDGAVGRAVQVGLSEAHRYVVYITHVKTGALRASHRMAYQPFGNVARGWIYIDPESGGFEWVNKTSGNGKRRVYNASKDTPAQYGPKEHARGGEHAFYARTEVEAGPRIANLMAQILQGSI